jgi:PhzF family phenazine biosynthesis protein
MEIYLVDAFTQTRFAGNPAGVVLDADGLSAQEMQNIARELNASETAFVSASSKNTAIADFAVRFFTPSTEIAFCGHATVALFHMLAATERISSGKFSEATKAGIVPVTVSRTGEVLEISMTQREAEFVDAQAERNALTAALGLSNGDLDATFPALLAKTANRHMMLGVIDGALSHINLDAQKLGSILRKLDAVTLHVFTRSETALYRARNFGPHIGISEDPATGSAAGAFGAYLHHIGVLGDGLSEFTIIQGEDMGRPGTIAVRVRAEGGEFKAVEMSGTAVQAFELVMAKAAVRA